MPTRRSPRKGSLQYWPRKRAAKFLPRSNWDAISTKKPIKGFICYKVGMLSAAVKDNTDHSMTKGKIKAVPVTILECPTMKILSIRFYKNGKVQTEVLNEGLDKELKRKLKLPKKTKKLSEIKTEEFDDLRIIVYSNVKKAKIKKTPDIVEIGLSLGYIDKLNYVKEHLNKEISVSSVFDNGQLVDIRGLTKGKGLVGPLKRFGLNLKAHKSEKGRRRPGSLGPWHPARVTFRAPQAGQLGMFSRTHYNNKILGISKDFAKLGAFNKYGKINSEYIILEGSVQGPAKRQLILTQAIRPTKKQSKKNHELIELR